MMIIKIATAECFTHGLVAREIHAFSQGYPKTHSWTLDPVEFNLSIIAGMFIPTLNGIKYVLKFNPITPVEAINDIKVYDQEGDTQMAILMAKAVKNITKADIGIATTAGIGKGSIAICNDKTLLLSSTEVYADLKNSKPSLIIKRQKSGIKKTLYMLECLIKNSLDDIESKEIKKINF